ncbi:baseplate wedge subunit protein [Caulobacter phage Cr30]|uniref:baseplate wedge subunit n=1 Tax=Caulobacter phage Cr30 TaxID=1357714 RepID=UPI0004A9B532|nr:baseplate wedge subunit [Caulobacter phage Cr30]AGS81113.1 baseplate wedge subunit protein [Caulobacter phage Cr30]
MRYFEAFQTIDYNNQNARNLLTRVRFLENAKDVISIYHPFTIQDGEDPRKIAYDYYGSTDYVWIIFLANNIIDPYHEWPLDTFEFEEFLKKKYGSLETAQSTILYYQKNPEIYYVSLTDPRNYLSSSEIGSADLSSFTRIEQDSRVKITPESFEVNPSDDFFPVSAYDYEMNLNEEKRNIKLIDNSYVRMLDRELKAVLNQ